MLKRHCPSLALAALLVLPSAAIAQEASEDDLRELRGEIAASEARQEEYQRQVDELGQETGKLRRQLVAITARVQEKEAAVQEAEDNLIALEKKEASAEAAFEKKSEALIETIAALQILQKNPPPALLVRPDDALDAARSAMLLSEIAPHLKEEADALAFKLTELRLIRDEVEAQKQELMKADKDLARERRDLQKSLAERENLYSSLSVRATLERQRLARMTDQARNMEQLLAALKAVAPTYPRAKPVLEQAPNPAGSGNGPRLAASEGFETALISKARGHLRPPALGRVVGHYGRPDGAGGHAKGITIATQPKAQVVAPFDGQIVYVGSLPGYGELLIIEAGEGYHLVLSGLTRINGVVGQNLLAGEPVGQMGSEVGSSGGTSTSTAQLREAAKPHLYFEMRQNGKPFDPEPWLTDGQRKVRG